MNPRKKRHYTQVNLSIIKLSKEHNYAIIDVETNLLIGNCGLMDLDNINRTAEIGIFIGNKDYWNKGFGTEAIILLCNYAFKYLNLNNIQLRVYSFNLRAIKSYEKLDLRQLEKEEMQ